ncbi:MAG: hypothetical protein KF758_09075 [Anaerolineales bacterium]|nr:hypothetical protein [Anaerolineales bacterium]
MKSRKLQGKNASQQSVHLTLEILRHFQAFSLASGFFYISSLFHAQVSPFGDDVANRWAK